LLKYRLQKLRRRAACCSFLNHRNDNQLAIGCNPYQ
jgi:hypothetical protein